MIITIAICTYNGSKRIHYPLQSLSQQVGIDDISWEVLVMDNASTDDTADRAIELGCRFGLPSRVIREEQPGKTYALKRALREARGKYFVILDDDNLPDPNWMKVAVEFLDTHPKAGLIGGRILPKYDVDVLVPPEVLSRIGLLAIRDLGDQVQQGVRPHGAGMAGRTDLFRTILLDMGAFLPGRIGSALDSGEDAETARMAELLGWECWYVPELVLEHYLPAHRLNTAYLQRLLIDAAKCYPWLAVLGHKYGWPPKYSAIAKQYLLTFRLWLRHWVWPPPREQNILFVNNQQWRAYYHNQLKTFLAILTRHDKILKLVQMVDRKRREME